MAFICSIRGNLDLSLSSTSSHRAAHDSQTKLASCMTGLEALKLKMPSGRRRVPARLDLQDIAEPRRRDDIENRRAWIGDGHGAPSPADSLRRCHQMPKPDRRDKCHAGHIE